MNTENVMLNETRQHKRPHIVRFHLHEISGKGKPIETKVSSGCLGLGLGKRKEEFVGGREVMAESYGVSFQRVKDLDSGDGCTTLRIYWKPVSCTLQMVNGDIWIISQFKDVKKEEGEEKEEEEKKKENKEEGTEEEREK